MTTTTNLTTKWYTMDNKEGVDLNFPQTISVTTNPEIPTGRLALGETVLGNNGSRWLFVQASTTVTANNLVAIDVNFAANDLTASLSQVHHWHCSVPGVCSQRWRLFLGVPGSKGRSCGQLRQRVHRSWRRHVCMRNASWRPYDFSKRGYCSRYLRQ
jgi:hypothetical protein